MLIERLFNQTSVPALDQFMQFAAARHQLLVNNIANIDTPGFVPQDLSVDDFRVAMAKALKEQRGGVGGLVLRGRQVRTLPNGRLLTRPEQVAPQGPPFGDGASRNIEKQMAALAENTLAFNVAAELLRRQFESLKTAVRQRS